MKTDKIYKTISKNVKLINHYAKNHIPPEEEEIHEMRTTYKKLRAFLRFMHDVNNKNGKVIPKKLKKLYQSAGALRDLQLHIKDIENDAAHHKLDGYANFLLLKANDAQNDLLNTINGFSGKRTIKKIQKNIPGKLSGTALQLYLCDKRNELNTFIRHNATDDNLHSARKIIKDILYLEAIFGKKTGYSDARMKRYKHLSDLLGAHNDMAVDIAFTEQVISKDIPKNEKDILKTRLKKVEEKKAKLHKQVDDTLKRKIG